MAYREVDSTLDSFAAFVNDETLREQVFEALLFSMPAVPAVVAAEGVVDRAALPAVIAAKDVVERAADRNSWPALSPAGDEELIALGAPFSRV